DRRRNGTGRQRAIIRSVGYTAGFVHPENPIDVVNGLRRWPGAVAGAHTPAERSIAEKTVRILLRVASLHIHGTATILEIVEPLVLHEPIDNSSQIEPTMTELVNEQRTGMEVFDSILLSP